MHLELRTYVTRQMLAGLKSLIVRFVVLAVDNHFKSLVPFILLRREIKRTIGALSCELTIQTPQLPLQTHVTKSSQHKQVVECVFGMGIWLRGWGCDGWEESRI
jgi:hypothetical protein